MSGNPTLDAANEATGVEPLNTGPDRPQTPQKSNAENNDIPQSLRSLPSGSQVVIFPLSLASKTATTENVSSLPDARKFEDLVKAIVHPSGPARAEVMETSAWQDKYSALLDKVREAVDGNDVQFYRVQTGVGKAEGYLVGLDADGERLLGARILSVEV